MKVSLLRFMLWCFLFGALIPTACAGIGSASAVQGPVLVMGDSLAAAHNIPADTGWVHLLKQRLANMRPPQRVINASISGETTLSGAKRLPALLKRYQPSLLILELGANDGLRGLALDSIRRNLDAMLRVCREADVRVLLLGIELPVNYGPRYRDGLRAIYTGLAQRYHVPLVPFLLQGIALEDALMQSDGLHPTAAAQPQVLANVWQKLRPMLSR